VGGAVGQAWPPFVLVAGLLLIGAVVEADGLFAALGARVERIGGGAVVLLTTLLGLEAVVAAVLNLDTAVAFMTPIVVHAALRRGCDDRPFVYGALFVASSASLLLPGSNLTNLIVLAHEPSLSGAGFARAMLAPWIVAVLVTIGYLAAVYRPRGHSTRIGHTRGGAGAHTAAPPLRFRVGAAATLAATLLILLLHNSALPVLAVGLVAVALRRVRPRIGLPVLAGLFVLAVALGTLARRWNGPASLLGHIGGTGDAVVGAAASVLLNNLPAATLLSAQRPPHPLELLVGLDLGPNLAVTGSLAAYLWWRAARTAGASPSALRVTLLGIGLAPLTIAGALVALAIVPR
jgi:arsenical pump membrane protein